MKLFVAGLSYKTAPVEVREQIAVPPSRLLCRGCRLKLHGNLLEVVLLSTCNRVEIYGVSPGPLVQPAELFSQLTQGDVDLSPYLYFKQDLAAVRHLFSVASGLDSMVLGETEITGQVKQAYLRAHQAKLTGKIMNRLFQTALQTAKEIRTRTAIGRGATSVGSVAVELAERIFDQDLSQKVVMIIGAGKMGEACVRHLSKGGARTVLVANRSLPRAQRLAGEFGGEAVPFEQCAQALARADIVVSSTGASQIVLQREAIAAALPARRRRPLFLVDIAVPRDIDPRAQHLPNVFLYDIDDLQSLVEQNTRLRQQELARAQAIVGERSTALMERLRPNPSRPVLPGMGPLLRPQPALVPCGFSYQTQRL